MPAGARPSGATGATGVADDVPQPPDEVVPYVPELIDFGALRDVLREEYPSSFAGLVNSGDRVLTIYETRASDSLHRMVAQRFQGATAKAEALGKRIEPTDVPRVNYRIAVRSLDSLFSVKERIEGSLDTLAARGIVVEAVGIQDGTNKVMVGVQTAPTAAQPVLEAIYGKGVVQAFEWKLTDEADRLNDSAPWNGGDQLVSEGNSFTSCTSGFGVHDSDGNHFVTTAGHCNSHFWWNTWAGFPIRDDTTLVGATNGSVWNGVYFGFRVDTQKVLTTDSSNIIWTNKSTRRYISAPLDVAQGDPTCIDGSFTPGQCGTIWATDFGEGGTEYLVDLAGGVTVFGDSGAPSWRSSPFGPLAQGTHVGSLSTGKRVELNIYAVMFFNGVALNTPWDP
jgi:hypothetical protein